MRRLPLFFCSLLIAILSSLQLWSADIVYVHQMRGNGGEDTGANPNPGEGLLQWEDDQWRALLEGAGHTIIAHDRFDDLDNDDSGVEVLNSADIVIFSRDSNSGNYDEGIEPEIWTEGITAPMIIMTPFVLRNNRWDMADTGGIVETNKDVGIDPLEALVPDHPIFAGVLEGGEADIWDEELLGDEDSIDFLDILDDDGKIGLGEVLAVEPSTEVPWIVYWEQGSEFYEDSLNGWTAGGDRLYYSIGSDDDRLTWGEKNTTPAGDQILLNAIDWMTGGGSLIGDFNGSGALDIEDINLLTVQSAARSNDATFDLTGDGMVNSEDVTTWIKDPSIGNSWIGDANYDGEFNSGDFVQVFQGGKFEQEVDATWSDGDWNGDGRFNSGDFVVAFQDGGFEMGPRTAIASVPEPGFALLLLSSLILICGLKRR